MNGRHSSHTYSELQTYSILAANQSTIDRFFSHATNPVAQIFRYVHEGEREEESFRRRSDFSRGQKKNRRFLGAHGDRGDIRIFARGYHCVSIWQSSEFSYRLNKHTFNL